MADWLIGGALGALTPATLFAVGWWLLHRPTPPARCSGCGVAHGRYHLPRCAALGGATVGRYTWTRPNADASGVRPPPPPPAPPRADRR